jgi:hypothetical protein
MWQAQAHLCHVAVDMVHGRKVQGSCTVVILEDAPEDLADVGLLRVDGWK